LKKSLFQAARLVVERLAFLAEQYQKGLTEEAIQTNSHRDFVSSKEYQAWRFIGRLYTETEDFDKAKKALERSLQLKPNDVMTITRLGILYYTWGKLELAEAFLKQAVGINSNHQNAWYYLASIYRSQGRLLESYEAFKNVHALKGPDNAMFTLELSLLLILHGHFEESASCWERAKTIDPKIEGLVKIEIDETEKELPAKLKENCSNRLVLNPNDIEALSLIIEQYESEGNFAVARRLIQRAIELDPENDQFLESFKRIEQKMTKKPISSVCSTSI